MAKMHYYLFIILCLCADSRALECETTLAQTERFQAELLTAWDDFVDRNPFIFNTQEIGGERRWIDSSWGDGGHVINLAGGSDILRMMYLFPYSGHYHIADRIDPTFNHNVVESFIERVRAIGNGVRVRIVRPGFYRRYKELFGNEINPIDYELYTRFAKEMRSSKQRRRPLVMEVQWDDSPIGPVKRLFYYHPIDLKIGHEVQELVDAIPRSEPLVAMMMSGVAVGTTLSSSQKLVEEGRDQVQGYWVARKRFGRDLERDSRLRRKEAQLLRLVRMLLSNHMFTGDDFSTFWLHRYRFFYRNFSAHHWRIHFTEGGRRKFLHLRYFPLRDGSAAALNAIEKNLQPDEELVGIHLKHGNAMETELGPLFERLEPGGVYIRNHGEDEPTARYLPGRFRLIHARQNRPTHLDPYGEFSNTRIYEKE